jgi:pimeloyl-ACP methyl ester carboxylesterase
MSRIAAHGLSIACDSWGAGRPVVLVHGMGSWRRTWPRFEVPGYRFYAFDLPGFGESTLPRRRQGLDDFARTLAAVLAALGPQEPPLVVAHSFGAMVAVRALASGLAPRVHAVLLVAPAGFLEPEGTLAPTPLYALNRLLLWVTGSQLYGRRMIQALGVDPDTLDPARRRDLQRGWRLGREMCRMGRFYEYPGMAADLKALLVPHVILMGDRDPLFPLARIRPALDGLRVEWLPGRGHVPFLEDPQAFDALLARALTALYPTGSPA